MNLGNAEAKNSSRFRQQATSDSPLLPTAITVGDAEGTNATECNLITQTAKTTGAISQIILANERSDESLSVDEGETLNPLLC